MADKPKDDLGKIDSMAFHSISDPIETALFELLEEKCGDMLPGVERRSINLAKALPPMMIVTAHLLAQLSPVDRVSLVMNFSEGIEALSQKIRADYGKRIKDRPQ